MAGTPEGPSGVVQQAAQGAPSDLPQATAQAHGAKQFKQLAAAGGFGITQEGFDTMIRAIHNGQDMLMTLRPHVQAIKRGMALGTAPVAQRVAQFDQSVATGEPESLETVLDLYSDTLDDVETGLRQALKNYQKGECDNTQALKKVLGQDA